MGIIRPLSVKSAIKEFAQNPKINAIVCGSNNFKTGSIVFEKIPNCGMFKKTFVRNDGVRISGVFDAEGTRLYSSMENYKGGLHLFPSGRKDVLINGESVSAANYGGCRPSYQYNFGQSGADSQQLFVQGNYGNLFGKMYRDIGIKWNKFEDFIKQQMI